MKISTHRLEAGHTWEELHAFLTHFRPIVNCMILADHVGRLKFSYQLARLVEGRAVDIPVAESFFSLQRGWQYALPPGTPPGIESAARVATVLSDALT